MTVSNKIQKNFGAIFKRVAWKHGLVLSNT